MDLRWDNFDFKLTTDVNLKLQNTNAIFKRYADKVILYAGVLKPYKPDNTDKIIFSNNHEKLDFAGGMIFYALSERFGFNDGLVPYKSALLCDSDNSIFPVGGIPPNFVCSSPFRVRRFEFNDNQNNDLPDAKTLSITRIPRGFDHEDMRDELAVLRLVRMDLLDFAKKAPYEPLPIKTPPIKIVAPEIPTLFLFDVSGSMLENGKIEQARTAGLRALG